MVTLTLRRWAAWRRKEASREGGNGACQLAHGFVRCTSLDAVSRGVCQPKEGGRGSQGKEHRLKRPDGAGPASLPVVPVGVPVLKPPGRELARRAYSFC